MILIEREKCEDTHDAKRNERKYNEELNANLNMTTPLRTDREYREDNKDKLKEYEKYRYEKNKEAFKEKYTCECGKLISHGCKLKHNKRNHHQTYLNSLSEHT